MRDSWSCRGIGGVRGRVFVGFVDCYCMHTVTDDFFFMFGGFLCRVEGNVGIHVIYQISACVISELEKKQYYYFHENTL